MNFSTNWDAVPSPIGPISVPGFDRLRALSDEELCIEMNTARFVDPAALQVAMNRPHVVCYLAERGYVWNTLAGWKEWKALQPTFLDVLLAAVRAADKPQGPVF